MAGAESGRVHHRPRAELAAIEEGLRARGLVDGSGRFTASGWTMRDHIEAVTDELAQPPYDALTDAELQELVAGLEPITAASRDRAGPRLSDRERSYAAERTSRCHRRSHVHRRPHPPTG